MHGESLFLIDAGLIKRGCGTFLSIRTIAVFSFALETTLPSKTLEIVVVEIFVGDAILEEEEAEIWTSTRKSRSLSRITE